MKIFSAAQIRAWDAYTIENEPIASLELMNRAARVFSDWFIEYRPERSRTIVVFAGTGNNGGDGLAVARMLEQAGYVAKVVVCDFGMRHSADFEAQLAMAFAENSERPLVFESFAVFEGRSKVIMGENDLVIDALFGSGLNRPLTGDWLEMADFLNKSGHEIVSIDLPSGLFCDVLTGGKGIVRASATLSFQTPKRAFFFPENAEYLGAWTYRNIRLHPAFAIETETPYHYLTLEAATSHRKIRSKFSHKGTYGHALLIAGSLGKMGASVLAARACLRSGAGLLTVHAPNCGNLVLQSTVPEAMMHADKSEEYWTQTPALKDYSSIGVGPGIGRATETAAALKKLLKTVKVPLVLDADALNLIAENNWLELVPENTILSPHPKEFERLFGKTKNGFERNELLRRTAQKHRLYIILKGANTAIAFPDGMCWFNSSGNPGMATGGSGDVLTGILSGLLAQGYEPASACLLGVFLHGLAGDLAAAELSEEALIAGDLIDFLGKAWQKLA